MSILQFWAGVCERVSKAGGLGGVGLEERWPWNWDRYMVWRSFRSSLGFVRGPGRDRWVAGGVEKECLDFFVAGGLGLRFGVFVDDSVYVEPEGQDESGRCRGLQPLVASFRALG